MSTQKNQADERTQKSETEIRIGKRYSVRRLGFTSWADTDSLRVARKQQRAGNDRAGYGHQIVDNRTGEMIGKEHENEHTK